MSKWFNRLYFGYWRNRHSNSFCRAVAVDNSFSNPIQYTKDNILGTHILLEVYWE